MKFTYTDKKTPIHILHPGCKLMWAFAVLIGSFMINDPIFLLLLFLSTIPFVIIGKITKEWSYFIKIVFFLSFFIIIINLFASQHGTHIFYNLSNIPLIGSLKLTLESLLFSISMSLRLFSTISAFAIVSLTINPDDLLQMFLIFKIPQKTVITTSISTRFIPCFLKDVDTLSDSLKTRGYQINDGGFIDRIKKRAILIPPLISSSLERAIQSAEAMEARAFGSNGKKSFYKKIKTTFFDKILIIFSASLLFYFLIIWFYSIGSYSYYPSLSKISFSIPYVLFSLFLFFIMSFIAFISHVKKVIDLD